MPSKYSKKTSKKRVSKKRVSKRKVSKKKVSKKKVSKRKVSKRKTKNAIPKNEVQFMKDLINNNNKSSIPSYTPLNNDNNYTPTMPATLSAVDTATMPKQQLLGAPNTNIDPLMINNMAPVNPQSYGNPSMGVPNMPISPMQGMPPMNTPPMGMPPMNAPPMGMPPMNAPPMGMPPMNAPPMPGMSMSPMQGMPMAAPPMQGMPPMQGGKIPDYTKCELIPSYTN